MQHDPALQDAMTYVSPTTGERVGLSFITPRTVQDLERRRTMMAHWARGTLRHDGPYPDFMNVRVTAMAAASDYLPRIARSSSRTSSTTTSTSASMTWCSPIPW